MPSAARRLVSCLLIGIVTGCAARGGGLTAFERERLVERERALAISAQRVHDGSSLARIERLLDRMDPTAATRVYLLEHPAPQAELIGGEVLLVRTGLLAAVHSDDELAFVLGHELAHRTLGHIGARRRADWDAAAAEMAADAWARARLAALGLQPDAGRALLERLMPESDRVARLKTESVAPVPPYEPLEP